MHDLVLKGENMCHSPKSSSATFLGSLDRHCRMKRIAMAIKFDHELRLTRRRSPDMQNFEADLSMMVPRPYESILGGKTPKYDFSEVAKNFLVENWPRPGRDRIPAGRGS